MGDFVQRMARLDAEVGDGDLVMGAVVQQAYAAAQHNKNYRHRRGGIPRFLEVPFAAQREEMLMKLAFHAIVPTGSHLRRAAREIAEMFDEMVTRFAPRDNDVLRDSTATYVIDNGRLIYADAARDSPIWGKYEGVPGPYE